MHLQRDTGFTNRLPSLVIIAIISLFSLLRSVRTPRLSSGPLRAYKIKVKPALTKTHAEFAIQKKILTNQPPSIMIMEFDDGFDVAPLPIPAVHEFSGLFEPEAYVVATSPPLPPFCWHLGRGERD